MVVVISGKVDLRVSVKWQSGPPCSSTSLGLILTQCYQHGVTVSRVAGGSVGSPGLCTSTPQGGWSLPLPRR
ncbi:hypothetical protein Pcinc_016112 [Petrolisthes cinctipes]|uniref:Uncharacterized protein n=1 Tax=Petrolisthes cinctipes TaxID=88211 RepID=A0AAE1KMA9_PETCI|nr:hypothetical protein Pcinc_016112 [Petrolisthes cinctipes]